MKFKTSKIDLIITDLSMPKMNGSDFIKIIRDINHDIPIIILSAYTERKILYQSINYGIQGYLQKPIDNKTLLGQINTIKKENQEKNLIKEYQNITNASAIISKINQKGIITYVNETFCTLSGFKKEELIGQVYDEIKSKHESPNFFLSLLKNLSETKEVWSGILKHETKAGELYYLKSTIQPILNTHGEVEQFISLSIPITDIIHHEEQLNDYLKEHKEVILVLLKIEEFKYLQHSFTNKITKKLQTLFAKELLRYMPKEYEFSKVYLLNKGEFVFAKAYQVPIDEKHLSELMKAFQKKINKQKIKIGIVDYSLSIICSLAYGKDALDNARIGLKKILESKEAFILSTNFLEKATRDSHKKLNKFIMLKEAIASYNIISYFQPIINNQTLKTEKYESLVRLINKQGKVISPLHFLDIAKEGKYYHEITSIVLRNSFRALFNNDIQISINLSALDMEDARTKSEFFILLERYKTETHRITIELLEDQRINNQKSTQEFIKKIKTYGVKIALDDFGAGFSNFSRILSYQPDYIKIDGSLIRGIEHDKFSQDLLETIVFFSKKQNIKTIAEFVENENIFNILKKLGVDYSQGHYFSKARLLSEFNPSDL
ncbi:MAG: diguanylate cyclase/phosphodiesterase (GGDEF & EAL domains) with PAS/PAC sensor(s) [uncultured Sulfurovum sp.]|uniref:Diguanylate cyclase/phosphodiesterase (GGDEF & EAL domains) with PAS/PAC sensor(S) n=1 Tax=uncultured Sulfurovum sp. TaxID=269237 RepID=A0A6S6TL81_9BACT|nr:MAG: diguanylate cyclase/phosphodiesterase (GGDEF & EAL domains) with PAS/PAC sensor(s) [uncultured Sulfurovum sp.]